jgi:hypothetical protein
MSERVAQNKQELLSADRPVRTGRPLASWTGAEKCRELMWLRPFSDDVGQGQGILPDARLLFLPGLICHRRNGR